jgi:hypothetical protein
VIYGTNWFQRPAPTTKYRCENGKCFESPTGGDHKLCIAACDPFSVAALAVARSFSPVLPATIPSRKAHALNALHQERHHRPLLGAGNFSIVPQSNCTAKLKLCYQGPLDAARLAMKSDPVNFCHNQHAAKLLAGNCAALSNFTSYKGMDPIYTALSLWA